MRNPIRVKNLRLRFVPYYVLGVVVLVWHAPAPGSLWLAAPWILSGVMLRAWGAGHLVKNDRLTITGPYAHLRHPLYLGTILIGTGFAVALGGGLALLGIALLWPWFAFAYFPRKERSESHRLLARYGDRFARYRAEVPALWPRWSGFSERTKTACAGAERWAFARFDDNNELGTMLAVALGLGLFGLRAAVGA